MITNARPPHWKFRSGSSDGKDELDRLPIATGSGEQLQGATNAAPTPSD